VTLLNITTLFKTCSQKLKRKSGMWWFSKKVIYPIGVEFSGRSIKLAQLCKNKNGLSLIASQREELPADIVPGSSDWQKWAIDAVKKSSSSFVGKNVIAAMLQHEVFINHVKIQKSKDENLHEAIISRVKNKLPFAPEKAILKHIQGNEEHYLVIASEKEKINRHLAIFENANLSINSIGVWPTAIANCYVHFFGRRQSDINAVVMLLNIETYNVNVVICCHKNVLLARSIAIAADELTDSDKVSKLVSELTSCNQYFDSVWGKSSIERVVFLCGSTFDQEICRTIAKQLKMPAQIGNCLAAVNVKNSQTQIDRRSDNFNWTITFGLSLQNE
jgi:Tfp pilus assembly PilM family ATPase